MPSTYLQIHNVLLFNGVLFAVLLFSLVLLFLEKKIQKQIKEFIKQIIADKNLSV